MGTLQDSGVFDGCQITIDFAVSSLPFKRKQEIRREVVENGGILSYILTRQVRGIIWLYEGHHHQITPSILEQSIHEFFAYSFTVIHDIF